MHLEIDRVSDDELGEIHGPAQQGAHRRPRRRRGLAADAHPGRPDHRGHRGEPAAARRPRSSSRASRCCAGWPTTTSPSSATASTPCEAAGRPRDADRRARHRLRHPARRPARPARAARGGGLARPRQAPAGAGQGQLAGDRAPAGVPRLRRREEVRRQRRGRRRAPLPGPVLLGRLHRVRTPDPGAAREGRRGDRHRRPRPDEPRRQGADGRARDLPARRAVPDPGRGPGPDRLAGDVHPGAAPAAAVRAARHLRPVPLLPGLPAARPLQHHRPRADRLDPQGAAAAARTSSTPRTSGSPSRRDCTSSYAPRRASRSASPTSPTSSAAAPRPPGPGATTSPPRSSRRTARSRAAATSGPTPAASPRPTRRTTRPRPARSTSAGSSRSRATRG